LTQKELSERTGIKQSNLSRLESGNYNPSLEFLQKVAAGLGKELYIEFRDPSTHM
ncbi:MAG: helix-turn-helix domain-containing protein, partial [Ruminiclostridium sp.]